MFFWFIFILLLILIFTTPPVYPYSRRWGYYPFEGAIGLFILLIVLWWFAWLPIWFYPR